MELTKRAPSASPVAAKRPKTESNGKQSQPKSSPSKKESIVVPDLEECGFSSDDLPPMRKALLSWYDANHRILPWRRNTHSKLSPETVTKAAEAGQHPAPLDLPINQFIYYVWVCEIMSQQTQVSRAAEYFRKWVAKWPDVHALAAATQEEVNDMWAGLGYYRRARFLLEGAKYIVDSLGGDFPNTSKELQKIPGVGAYTSNAIASIACGEESAVVDGNVIRVMARLRQLDGDPKSAAMTKLFANVAQQALDPDRPGDFNQAVMELGATVCVPNTQPSCGTCPINAWCSAFQAEKKKGGTVKVTDYPTKVEKADKREEHVAVAVLSFISTKKIDEKEADKYLLVKRPPGGLLAGLWEFPLQPLNNNNNNNNNNNSSGDGSDDGKDKDSSREFGGQKQGAINEFLQTLFGASLKTELSSRTTKKHVPDATLPDDKSCPSQAELIQRKSLGEVVHVFSHIRMTMHVEALTFQGPIIPECIGKDYEVLWLSEDELKAKGLSSGVKKVFKLFTASREKSKSEKTQSITRFFKPFKGS